jgi:ribosomal protein L40E
MRVRIRETTENLSTVAFCDEFICKKCGVHLAEWSRVKTEEGHTDLYEYEFKFCPECGARVKEGAKNE